MNYNMAKLRSVKCQWCSEQIDRNTEPFEHESKGYYHKTCHSEMKADRANREDLMSFISSLLGPQANLAFVAKQIKQFTSKYKMTHSGIKGTLVYLSDIKKRKLNPRMGIALVPYEYQNARKYFEGLSEVRANMVPYEKPETRVVYIERKQSRYKERNVKDLEAMFEEEFNSDN